MLQTPAIALQPAVKPTPARFGMAGTARDTLNFPAMSTTETTPPPADANPANDPATNLEERVVPTARDEQREALGNLIRLATECTTLDAQIEQQYGDVSKAAEKVLKAKVADLQAASLEEIALAQRARNVDVENVEREYKGVHSKVEAQVVEQRRKVETEYEKAAGRIKTDFQDATWLVESILDTALLEARKAYKAASEKILADRAIADEQRDLALATLHRYGQQHLATMLAEIPAPTAVPADAFEPTMTLLKEKVEAFGELSLARLFVGVWPYLASVLLIGGAIAWTQPWTHQSGQSWNPTLYAGGGAILFVTIVGIVLFRISLKQIRRTWTASVEAYLKVHASLDTRLAEAGVVRDKTVAEAQRSQQDEDAKVKAKFVPLGERAKARRDELVAQIKNAGDAEIASRKQVRDSTLHNTRRDHEAGIKKMEARRDQEIADATAERDTIIGNARAKHEQARAELVDRWNAGLAATKAQNAIESAAGSTRIGSLTIDLGRIATESGAEASQQRLVPPPPYQVPAWLSLPRQASLFIEHDRAQRDAAIELLRATMFNLLTTIPAGRVKFTLIDPVGLGQSFAAFMHLADHDDTLVGGRIWSEGGQIEETPQGSDRAHGNGHPEVSPQRVPHDRRIQRSGG